MTSTVQILLLRRAVLTASRAQDAAARNPAATDADWRRAVADLAAAHDALNAARADHLAALAGN